MVLEEETFQLGSARLATPDIMNSTPRTSVDWNGESSDVGRPTFRTRSNQSIFALRILASRTSIFTRTLLDQLKFQRVGVSRNSSRDVPGRLPSYLNPK